MGFSIQDEDVAKVFQSVRELTAQAGKLYDAETKKISELKWWFQRLFYRRNRTYNYAMIGEIYRELPKIEKRKILDILEYLEFNGYVRIGIKREDDMLGSIEYILGGRHTERGVAAFQV